MGKESILCHIGRYNRTENWYSGLVAQVFQLKYHEVKPSEISRFMSAIDPYISVFCAIIY